jgi:bifunctional non-homologous end joining protein LigD
MIEVDSCTALIGAAQANVIELHTWNATTKDPQHPDRIVFDLDPGEGIAWRAMQEGAELLRSLLEQIGLASFLKTSGGKGLHVVVPIAPKEDWDTVRALAKRIVAMAATIPGASSPEAVKNSVSKVRRLRNAWRDDACAWSARCGLGVSVTCEWTSAISRRPLDVRNAHERIEKAATLARLREDRRRPRR